MQRAQPPQTHIWGGLAPANSYMGGLGPCKLLHGGSGAAISYMGVLICFGPWELPCPPFPPRISRPGPAWTQGFCSQSVAVSCWAELANQPCFQAGGRGLDALFQLCVWQEVTGHMWQRPKAICLGMRPKGGGSVHVCA